MEFRYSLVAVLALLVLAMVMCAVARWLWRAAAGDAPPTVVVLRLDREQFDMLYRKQC